jgi:hypothetical protein
MDDQRGMAQKAQVFCRIFTVGDQVGILHCRQADRSYERILRSDEANGGIRRRCACRPALEWFHSQWTRLQRAGKQAWPPAVRLFGHIPVFMARFSPTKA